MENSNKLLAELGNLLVQAQLKMMSSDQKPAKQPASKQSAIEQPRKWRVSPEYLQSEQIVLF